VEASPYRAGRTIQSFGTQKSSDVTVLVGLYNARPYLNGLFDQITSQKQQNVKWLFLDNDSEDDTFSVVSQWLSSSNLDAMLVKNPINLGATGSYYTNLDLVETEWITFIHQDDMYRPDFVEILHAQAAVAPSETVLVYGDMGRVDEEGNNLGAYPSTAWMLPDHDPVTYFLALVRNHCVPWPALMVRCEVFEKVEPAWHSAAFPDTEATLKMTAYGTFIHVPVEVMKYRDNLSSESRSLLEPEREFGSALGLVRVFTSPEFFQILSQVEQKQREDFVRALQNSINVRISNVVLAKFVSTVAMEQIDKSWNHQSTAALAILSENFYGAGATRTTEQLQRMGLFLESDSTMLNSSMTTQEKPFLQLEKDEEKSKISRGLAFYSRFGGFMPHWLRIRLFPKAIKRMIKGNPSSAWNYDWRNV
jgi:glycosyltransferase involved in cell wall biosynthesis